ncbi:MAG: glutaminyl-peptide cyclotransferase [Ekhidna sp.]|nr:glutaminyl-peptide cyclotransferase [Ekhidna sp.]MBC6409391.1 glutaminyl-peptide cyclotransferase [Ekhidna sp.]MBC6425456.1 glutaminyl-peptide cyclotransferase [Ekhidna sp.]
MIRSGHLLLPFIFLIISCNKSKESEKTISPRIKKSTILDTPVSNQEFVRGTPIKLSFSSKKASIDSIQVTVNDETTTHKESSFNISLSNRNVGTQSIRAKVYIKGESETHYRKIIILPENPPQEMTYSVIKTYPHDTDDFTQGLIINDGYLYESTGQNGKSTFKKKDLRSGQTLAAVNLDQEYFGEGLAFINNQFYQLTWTSGVCFVYDSNMEQTNTHNYAGQGYGLTSLENELIFTDESEKLFFINPENFTIQREIEAYDSSGKADSLNELEVINGLIYANVWLRDIVLVINPKTGEVIQKIDFSGLLNEDEAREADVLNGIAFDPETNKIYVTGKYWPKLFEVTIEPKTIQQ